MVNNFVLLIEIGFFETETFWFPEEQLSDAQLIELESLNNMRYGMGHGDQRWAHDILSADWLEALKEKYPAEDGVHSNYRCASSVIVIIFS
jgi:hypothetical protein